MRAYSAIYLNIVENSSVTITLGAGDSTVASAERAAITSVTVAGHALAAVVSSASAITEGASSVTTTIAVIAADVASVVALVARSDGVGVRNTDADGGLVEGGRSIDGNLPGTGSHTVEGAIALEMREGRGSIQSRCGRAGFSTGWNASRAMYPIGHRRSCCSPSRE